MVKARIIEPGWFILKPYIGGQKKETVNAIIKT